MEKQKLTIKDLFKIAKGEETKCCSSKEKESNCCKDENKQTCCK